MREEQGTKGAAAFPVRLAGTFGLLAGLQALRWATESFAFAVLGRAPLVDAAVRALVYLVLLAVLAVIARRRGVRLRLLPEGGCRPVWALACAVCVGLLAATPLLTGQAGEPEVWVELACTTVATPLFEETLFRGYVWARFEEGKGVRASVPPSGAFGDSSPGSGAFPWSTVALTAVLFGLWHLGYADVAVWQLETEGLHGDALLASLAGSLAGKVALGAFVGLALGAVRARWGCLLPPALFHMVWNVLA